MNRITARELAEWLADGSRPAPVLLDVREAWEFDLCRLDDALHVPMHLVPARCDKLDPDRELVVVCHHGARSLQVALFLENKGFRNVHNLTGGVEAWAIEVAPGFRRY